MAGPAIGYLLPTRERAARGEHDVRPLIEQARRAETLGFDSVWVGDSPLTRPRADALLVLAAAAAVTERVTVGTAVLLAALRHPIPLAHQLATLDRIADGRLIVGMGAGFPDSRTQAQFESIGVDFRRRVSRLEESIEAMRRLWSAESASFTGRHFEFHDATIAPRPVRPGGPPIWLAGSGVPALARVSRLAEGWLPYHPTWQAYAQDWATVRESARTITPALYATVCLDEDPERARSRLRASVERYYNAPLELVESVQAMVAGPAPDTVGWLTRYADAGTSHLVLRLVGDDHAAALEEFAHLVLPRLRQEGTS